MANYHKKKIISDVDVNHKTVLVHLDLDVPLKNGKIINDRKIKAAMATIFYLLRRNCKVIILSHLGNIKSLNDKISNKYSLKIVHESLEKRLQKHANRVIFSEENYGEEVIRLTNALEPKDVLLLENTKYCDIATTGEYVGFETRGDLNLGAFWASLADIFVEDAFSVVHKKYASNYGVAINSKESAIGFLISSELNHLDLALENPKRPYLALIGGNYVADKMGAIEVLCERADRVVIGGALVFSFLYAKGYDVGLNHVERDYLDEIGELLEEYEHKILLVYDFLCNNEKSDTPPIYLKIDEGIKGFYGLDVGKRSLSLIEREIRKAKTVLWNGSFGLIENIQHYASGTIQILKTISKYSQHGLYSIISDNKTSTIAEYLGLDSYLNFISSGGSASLAYIQDTDLYGLAGIDNYVRRTTEDED
ncbi:phosphoglycerate kinase [Ureaplasma zalophigenitalium]|uniref:Phosphoglycerate kinase n=1 Tax=Ureaplasma zalophigenitalium TaxID=907723 RepID=A0ABT3BPJ5_9BACT|nr:phosphoglycerate kinase [Ureaplasma zalophigenitalium]MCV3754170.1 phosphoglycerate kinase [Ureaplasma zalophigenitalium]